jgi:hypothetical protein
VAKVTVVFVGSGIILRVFEHFAILLDPVTEFLKLSSALHSKVPILGPKIS